MRQNNRTAESLRPISIERGVQLHADASVLIRMGNTHVICGVSVEESVPPFMRGSGKGWITAEYGMLPCATDSRYRRETNGRSGRTMEIQRLIGRSLRMMVDLETIGERTLRVDCDVLNADGGTRTASITGGALALRDAFTKLHTTGLLEKMPEIMPVVAISVGMKDGQALLDLDYVEDSSADADANFVMAGDGRWIEVQSTAEGRPFSHDQFLAMADLAQKGSAELLQLWRDQE
ncbi:ribonuclease PH [Desulfotalea psychrophila]|nr:ribonuclease PH [Desulfotalea psychrophila]